MPAEFAPVPQLSPPWRGYSWRDPAPLRLEAKYHPSSRTALDPRTAILGFRPPERCGTADLFVLASGREREYRIKNIEYSALGALHPRFWGCFQI
jgi:hypothetical protein